MSKFVITLKHQQTRSYAKRVLPIVIILCSLANHIHLAGIGLSVLAIGLYLFLLIIDLATKRINSTVGMLKTASGKRIKITVYIWISYAILQSIFVILIKSDASIITELLSYVVNLALMLSILRFTETEDDLMRYARLIVLCTIVELVICHYEMATGNHIRTTTFRHYKMVFGTYYNENDLSVMLALGSLTILYYGTFIKRRLLVKYLVGAVLLADCLYMIVYTRSRGGFLGFVLVAAMILIAILFGRRYNLYKTVYRISFIIVILLFLFALAIGAITVTDENDVARMLIYQSALNQFRLHPATLIFGFGAGQFRANIGFALHNLLLQILGDFGLIGVLCYLYLICGMLKWPNLYQTTINDSVRKTCVVICALLTIFFGLVVSDFGSIKLSWIILGLYYAENISSLRISQG